MKKTIEPRVTIHAEIGKVLREIIAELERRPFSDQTRNAVMDVILYVNSRRNSRYWSSNHGRGGQRIDHFDKLIKTR